MLGESSFSNIACGGNACRKKPAGALESTRAGDMLWVSKHRRARVSEDKLMPL